MGRFRFPYLRVLGLGAAAMALVASHAAQAAAPAEFYKGRTVFVIVGYTPGGGYDLYARVLAQHLGKHIPGNPTVIPQNMPGAGSLKAANYIYSVAPKDGSVIGTFARAMGSAPLIGHANFDTRKFTWLGSIARDVTLCVSWATSPIKTWNDVMTKQFTVGGDGADADPDIFAKLYKNVFGAKIKLATGFPGQVGGGGRLRPTIGAQICSRDRSEAAAKFPASRFYLRARHPPRRRDHGAGAGARLRFPGRLQRRHRNGPKATGDHRGNGLRSRPDQRRQRSETIRPISAKAITAASSRRLANENPRRQ